MAVGGATSTKRAAPHFINTLAVKQLPGLRLSVHFYEAVKSNCRFILMLAEEEQD